MPTTPERFGTYEVVGEIARGGMGAVYKVRSPGREGVAALKVMLAGAAATPDMVQRFAREVRATRSLQHPNIVAILDDGVSDGHHFFVMAYVEGRSLAAEIDEGAIPVRRAVELARTIADALRHAHERGVVHRDIKPSNILMDTAGQPHLTDFGLAKSVEVSTALTKSGMCVGTPEYMPPEQAQGNLRQIDGRSDLYSLGVVLYEMLTCKTPFESDNPSGTIYRLLTEDAVPPRRFNPQLDRAIETVCLKLLDKNPEKRYQTAAALLSDLDAWLGGRKIAARRPSSIARWFRKAKRASAKRSGLILGIAATVFALAAFITLGPRGGGGLTGPAAQRARLSVVATRWQPRLADTGLQVPDPERRLRLLTEALGALPGWPPWLIERAIAAVDRGLPAEAWSDAAAAEASPLATADEVAHARLLKALVAEWGRADRATAKTELDRCLAAAPPASTPPATGTAGAGVYALARAFRAACDDPPAAETPLPGAEEDVRPWERYLVEGFVHERAGRTGPALQAYQLAVRSRSKAPTFAIGLYAMGRAARALAAAGGSPPVPPPSQDPPNPLFLETNAWVQSFLALVEATRRAPALEPPRAALRELCRHVMAAGVTGLDADERALAMAHLDFCEGRLADGRTACDALMAGKAAAGASEARALAAIATWTLAGDADGARTLLEPLAAEVVPNSRPNREREPVELAKRIRKLLGVEAPIKDQHLLTPLGSWATAYLKARALAATDTTAALEEYRHLLEGASPTSSHGRPWPLVAAWPAALVEVARLRLAERSALATPEGQARFRASTGGELTGLATAALRELAAVECPGVAPEALASEPVEKLRDRLLAVRHAAESAMLAARARRDLAVCTALAPGWAPGWVAAVDAALATGDGPGATALLDAATKGLGEGHVALAPLREKVAAKTAPPAPVGN